MPTDPPIKHHLYGQGWCDIHKIYFPFTRWGCPICRTEETREKPRKEITELLERVREMNKHDTD